jgi:hypothetical protein
LASAAAFAPAAAAAGSIADCANAEETEATTIEIAMKMSMGHCLLDESRPSELTDKP